MQLFRSVFFYFMFYSFLGWIIESVFNLCTKGSFMKANFLMLPLKPMYGIASTLLIYIKLLTPTWLFLMCAFIIPTLIEYLTADLLSHLYHIKYWNYSHCKYQYKGYICLKFSIYWFILSASLGYGLQPIVASFYSHITWVWYYFCPVVLIIFLIDLMLTLHNKHLSKHLDTIH